MSVPRLVGSVRAVAPDTVAGDTLVLLPSLGTTTTLWNTAITALSQLAPSLRIVTVDHPGHGLSPRADDAFTVGDLATAVLRIVDDLGGGRFHMAGVSLGGSVALELAAAHPDRILSFSMFCSGAKIGDAEAWTTRAAQVRASGTASLVAGSAERWFGHGYLNDDPRDEGAATLTGLPFIDDESYARCCEALASFDRVADLPAITVPALLVAGGRDPITTPESMAQIAAALPNARFETLPEVGHLAALEAPIAAAELLAARVARDGMRVRREVLGDAHVNRANAAITPETAPFQDFITRYAWGDIWDRPGLSRRDRSIATLASLVTGSHESEVRMHVRAALTNGLTRAEIAEVILHTALYAGLPPANAALATMREVFATIDEESRG